MLSGIECSVASVLAYIFRRTVAETNFHNAVCRITVCGASVFALASFLASSHDGPCSGWSTDARTCSRGPHCVQFSLPGIVVRLVDNEAFIKLLDESSFDLTNALLHCGLSQKIAWTRSYCVGWAPYSVAESSVARAEDFTVLGQTRSTDGELNRRRLFQRLPLPGC